MYKLKCECGWKQEADVVENAYRLARGHCVLGTGHAVTATKPLHNTPGRRSTIAFIASIAKRPMITGY